jgi:hypothetical protein
LAPPFRSPSLAQRRPSLSPPRLARLSLKSFSTLLARTQSSLETLTGHFESLASPTVLEHPSRTDRAHATSAQHHVTISVHGRTSFAAVTAWSPTALAEYSPPLSFRATARSCVATRYSATLDRTITSSATASQLP